MSSVQFCLIVAAIYIAPDAGTRARTLLAAAFLIAAAIEMFR